MPGCWAVLFPCFVSLQLPADPVLRSFTVPVFQRKKQRGKGTLPWGYSQPGVRAGVEPRSGCKTWAFSPWTVLLWPYSQPSPPAAIILIPESRAAPAAPAGTFCPDMLRLPREPGACAHVLSLRGICYTVLNSLEKLMLFVCVLKFWGLWMRSRAMWAGGSLA